MKKETRDDHLEQGPGNFDEEILEEFPMKPGSPDDQAVEEKEGANGPKEGSPFELPEKLRGKGVEELSKIIVDNDRMISKQGERLARLEEENSALADMVKKFIGKEEKERPDIDVIAREKGLGAALEVFGEKLVDLLYERMKKEEEEKNILARESQALESMKEAYGEELVEQLSPLMASILKRNPSWRNVPNYMYHILIEAINQSGISIPGGSGESETSPAPFPRASRSTVRKNETEITLSPGELEILDNYGVKVEDYIKYRKSGGEETARRKAGI
ncbi:MAG: hypothetical protein J7M18_08795 [Candidatus Eremiobacteraeota bacterium]|nr:hypothetical protein [Candidatus Eremiobacteraeota bacterium]